MSIRSAWGDRFTDHVFCLFAVVVVTGSCTPSLFGTGPVPLLPDLLGIWAWECSSGGFAGETICSETSGITQTWEFQEDSIFRWLRCGKLANKELLLSAEAVR